MLKLLGRNRFLWQSFLIVMIMTVLLSVSLKAQETGQEQTSEAATEQTADTPDDPTLAAAGVAEVVEPEFPKLESYVDGLVKGVMDTNHVAGVTLSVVRDGRIILKKGYGFTGDDRGVVDPDNSLFRIGSISKLFTYLSIMQLVEEGKLSLNTEVNSVLPSDLQLQQDGFEEPILIWHLLTHSAGYEDSALGHLFVNNVKDLTNLKAYLQSHQPKRIRRPGVIASYSNFSVAVAGMVVQNLSGKPFLDYVDDNILKPLAMHKTTFREVTGRIDQADRALADLMSTGYRYTAGGYERANPEYISDIAPAGSAYSTAADMARYMMATLNMGAWDGQRVLSEELSKQMRMMTFSNGGEALPGLAHGYMTRDYGPYRAFGHGGATSTFFSFMMMIDETKTGVFVSTNTNTGRSTSVELVDSILSYIHADAIAGQQKSGDIVRGDNERYFGTYLTTRRGYSNLEKFLLGVDGFTAVSEGPDGTLLTTTSQGTHRWRQKAPLVFQDVQSDERLVFKEDEDGNIISLSSGMGITAAEKVMFWDSMSNFQTIAIFALLIALLTLYRNINREKPHYRETVAESFSARMMSFVCFIWLAWAVVFVFAIMQLMSDPNVVFNYPTKPLVISVWIADIAVVLTAVSFLSLWSVWREGRWPTGRRVSHTFVSLVLVLLSLMVINWRLAGIDVI